MKVGEAERGVRGHTGVHHSLINPQEHEAATLHHCAVQNSNSVYYICILQKRKPSSLHIIDKVRGAWELGCTPISIFTPESKQFRVS